MHCTLEIEQDVDAPCLAEVAQLPRALAYGISADAVPRDISIVVQQGA